VENTLTQKGLFRPEMGLSAAYSALKFYGTRLAMGKPNVPGDPEHMVHGTGALMGISFNQPKQ
jgi:hypothetical protein